ncbi:MAG: acyloxyacyl hydrolase [Proteobacteria bacterium]|nr:acyloxyacyl hydrolase [Pseudomonadota bacterium]
MKQRAGALFFLLALIALTGICPSLQAADEGPLSQKGTKQLGVNIGYGYTLSNRDIRFAPVSPYFGYVFTDPVGNGWYRGTVEGIVEGDFNYVFKGQKRHASGVTFLGRYNLLSKHECWRPYIQAGVGMVGTNLSMHHFGSDFNFTSNLGAGIQYFWNPCNAVNFEWRYKHISNAGINQHNVGLNMSMLLVGYSHTF